MWAVFAFDPCKLTRAHTRAPSIKILMAVCQQQTAEGKGTGNFKEWIMC